MCLTHFLGFVILIKEGREIDRDNANCLDLAHDAWVEGARFERPGRPG